MQHSHRTDCRQVRSWSGAFGQVHGKLARRWTTLVFPLEGNVTAGPDLEPVPSRHFGVFDRDDDGPIQLHADAGTRVLVLAGRPLDEPVVAYGPFVMNTREEIEQALAVYPERVKKLVAIEGLAGGPCIDELVAQLQATRDRVTELEALNRPVPQSRDPLFLAASYLERMIERVEAGDGAGAHAVMESFREDVTLRDAGIRFRRAILPCGHYTLGRPPFYLIDAFLVVRFFQQNLR